MYKDYFGFVESPFSIVPNSRYLFLSSRHREAMGHLQTGLGGGGGFAMLTGEVGTGKTTVSKAMLASLNDNVKAGLILNPTFSETDLLEAICDEFGIRYPENGSLKQLTQAIHQYLLANHGKGIQTLLLIDEAQHLSTEVLEQLRLLTNLETESQKLLKVLLVGQPELQLKLQTGELRQLAQRITGRYHLLPLTEKEVSQYIGFRLQIAGCHQPLFSSRALKIIARHSQGVPRLINLVCDKALLYTYYSGEHEVSGAQAQKACQDVMSFQAPVAQNSEIRSKRAFPVMFSAVMAGIVAAGLVLKFSQPLEAMMSSYVTPASQTELNQIATMPSPVSEQTSSIQTNPEQTIAATDAAAVTEPATASEPVVEAAKPAVPQPTMEEILAAFVEKSYSPVEAMQVLYRLWGVNASVLDADCSRDDGPFYCETRYGSLQTIVAEKRPVILTLYGERDTFFAVLYGVYDDKIELLNNSQRVVLPKEWLDSHWTGEYQTLWYSEINQILRRNSRGRSVERLDTLLARVLGDEPRYTNLFDKALENRVRAFQTWQGLVADGVVGKNTLRILDRMTTEFAPEIITTKEGVY